MVVTIIQPAKQQPYNNQKWHIMMTQATFLTRLDNVQHQTAIRTMEIALVVSVNFVASSFVVDIRAMYKRTKDIVFVLGA